MNLLSVEYVTLHECNVRVVCALFLGFVFWFFVMFFYYRWRVHKYMHKEIKVPDKDVYDCDVKDDAVAIHDFIMRRLNQVTQDDMSDARYGMWSLRHFKKYYNGWFGFTWLKCFLWLLYSLGLSMKIYTSHDPNPNAEADSDTEDAFIKVTHGEKAYIKGATIYSFITLLLSGGALLSIIAFVLLWVC